MIEFDDFKLELFALEVRGLTDRAHVDQRTGQERSDRFDIDGKAAFHLAVDHAHDHFVSDMSRLQTFPGLGALGFFARQLGLAETIFNGFQRDLHFITNIETALTVGVSKLIKGDHPLRLQTCVDSDPLVINVDHHSGHN